MSTPTKAKATTTVTAAAADQAASAAPAASTAPMRSTEGLRLGNTVMVQLAPGAMLRNTETGGWFDAATPMPQTVTVTLLRRLQDGDLLLCSTPAP